MSRKLNIIDLFAGCGGLSDGFEQTEHFHSIACVEWEKQPCNTLQQRLHSKWGYINANEIVLQFDIQRTQELINGWENDKVYSSGKGLLSLVNGKKIDAIIGGPPCQAYSIAGRVRDENGMHDDYRNYLFESYLEIVKRFKPKFFVFENVEGILSAKPGGVSIIERIKTSFNQYGYSIIENLRKSALFNTADFGVPQNRKRVIIIGVDREQIKADPQMALTDYYTSINKKYKAVKKTTVKDAISDLPVLMPLPELIIKNGKRVSHSFNGHSIGNHVPRCHSKRDQKIFQELAYDKMYSLNKYPDIASLIELYYNITGIRSNFHKYNVLGLNEQSNTIPAHLYKDGLRHIHPDPIQARSITPREAARLQSFDDDFEFTGSIGDQYKMIGNAVPPKFAKAVANALKEFSLKYF